MLENSRDMEGLFRSPQDNPPKWAFMLTMYVDESGHETTDWMFLAGFLGNEDQCKKCCQLWKDALGPQRKHLHMKTLRFKKDCDRQLLARLGPIPDECGLTPVLGGIKYEHYKDLVAGTKGEKLLKGYIACLYPLIINVLRSIPRNERLEIIFEAQNEYQPYAEHVLTALSGIRHHKEEWFVTEDGAQKLAKWSFVPKNSTVLTEPADYFAYALWQLYQDKNSRRSEWCAPILKSGNGEGIGRIMSREEIRMIVKQTPIMSLYLQIAKRLGGSA